MMQDIRFGVRMLLKSKVFTAVAVLMLALGIGANTAVFSIVDAVLLQALPYAEPERLVVLGGLNRQRGNGTFTFSHQQWQVLQEQHQAFAEMAGYAGESFTLTGVEEPERLQATRVSASFFQVFGLQPALGRAFLPGEDQPGGNQVVVVSYSLWQRRFGANPQLIGKTLTLNGRYYTVIGIMPPSFQFPSNRVEVWAPGVFEVNIFTPEQVRNGASYLLAVARLKSGATLEQAQAELLLQRDQQQNPAQSKANPKVEIQAKLLQDSLVENVRTHLLVLWGVVSLVLLLVCVNTANLLLARAATRQKELAIRAALGAGRLRIVRQLFTESILLALPSSVLGLLLAVWGVKLLLAAGPDFIPLAREVGVDGRLLGYLLALSLLTGVLSGLAPALRLSKSDLHAPLKDEVASVSESLSGNRLRSLLVVAEVALSFVLLAGAGLLVRSYWRLEQVPLGVNPQGVLTMGISLPPAKYPEPHQKTAFYDEVLQRVDALPGVQSAAITLGLPLSISLVTQVLKEGRPEGTDGERLAAVWTPISPGYFRTMGIPLLKGRVFNERDQANAPNVVIISEGLARQFWPREEPLGKRITVSRNSLPSEIVGVVGEVKNNKLESDSLLQIYTPYPQRPWPSMSLVIRVAGDPLSMTTAVRNQVLAVDKDQPVTGVQTMEQVIAASKSQSRFTTQLISSFALVALTLAAFGIYGVMSFSVAQRRHEIGIRMALGAQAGAVLRLIIRRGMMLTLLGVGIGLGGAWALARLIKGLLFGVSETDPVTFGLIALLLTGVAGLACWVPARRATKVDPIIALRYE